MKWKNLEFRVNWNKKKIDIKKLEIKSKKVNINSRAENNTLLNYYDKKTNYCLECTEKCCVVDFVFFH